MPYPESGSFLRPGQEHMRRIVVSLLKGGVAKSETAVNLAHGLAQAGQKVLLVDTDVQAQCNDMLGITPARGLADIIAGWCSPFEALAQARDNLWLLAGGNDLAAVKMEIARREMAPEAVLEEALADFDQEFDVMVMDTAPGWDTLLVNALYCSREVLSPVSMEPMALSGLMRFEERLLVIQKYNPRLTLRWVVPTFVDGRVRKTEEIMSQLVARYGDKVAPGIKYSVKLSEAPAFGRTIYEHDPKGVAAQCYLALTQKILHDGPLPLPVSDSQRETLKSIPKAVPPHAPRVEASPPPVQMNALAEIISETPPVAEASSSQPQALAPQPELRETEDEALLREQELLQASGELGAQVLLLSKPLMLRTRASAENPAPSQAAPENPPLVQPSAPSLETPPGGLEPSVVKSVFTRAAAFCLSNSGHPVLKERLKEGEVNSPRLDSDLEELRKRIGQDGRA